MRRVFTWTAAIILVLALVAFLAFLYFIPPFFVAPPESFSGPLIDAAPPVTWIADPAARAIAGRGREIVMRTGCTGCHMKNGSQGPDYSKYLAGGGLRFESDHGTIVSRNLTPDPETGIGRRTDADVKRVIRSGVFPDGRVTSTTAMPFADLSNLTDEDLHAVVVYLRHLPAVRNRIPEPDRAPVAMRPGALEQVYGGRDNSIE